MAWQDELRPASIGGVPMRVESTGGESGRRLVIHDYPGRDRPLIEDMGRSRRTYSFRAYVIGPDYIQQRNDLIAVLDSNAVLDLIHPTHGERRVRAQPYSYEESKDRGGICEFSLSFIEDLDFEVTARPDTGGIVLGQAAAVDLAAAETFDAGFNLDGVPGFVRDAAVSDLELTGLDATGILDAVSSGSVPAFVQSSLRNMDDLDGLVSFCAPFPDVPALTPTRLIQMRNACAIQGLVRSSAVAQLARNVAVEVFPTFDAAQTRLAGTVGLIEATADAVANDQQFDLYRELGTLASMVVRDVTARGANLARVVDRRSPEVVGALVDSYRYFEDANRVDEMVSWNPPIGGHPAFLPEIGRRLSR